MRRPNSPTSFLYLQLGQEVIYLLLATTAIAALIMAVLLSRALNREAEVANREKDVAAREALLPGNSAVQPNLDPVFYLTEVKGFTFDRGSAELSQGFQSALRADDTVNKIVASVKAHGTTVLDVVGHTDETAIAGLRSNLDDKLLPYLAGSNSDSLQFSDNVGLGMARAAAVAKLLKSEKVISELNLKIVPFSAGQAIEPGDRLATFGGVLDDRNRRRIEIRLRRPTPE